MINVLYSFERGSELEYNISYLIWFSLNYIEKSDSVHIENVGYCLSNTLLCVLPHFHINAEKKKVGKIVQSL